MKRFFAFLQLLIAGLTSCVNSSDNIVPGSPDPERTKAFTDTIGEKTVGLYALTNKNGMTVEFTNYGATIVSIVVPDKAGNFQDVTLGYDNIEGYYNGNAYFGCVVGRYANRIAKGKFTLEGKEYTLPTNNGANSLHGGVGSIDKQAWDVVQGEGSITFSIVIPDGANGYPGKVDLNVTYTLRDDNSIVMDYSAVTDKTTHVNVTNHAYFNLSGDPNKTILDHELMINANAYTPVDSTLIPTGELRDVKGSAFDFTAPKAIGKDIASTEEQIVIGKGYDHNYVLNKVDSGLPSIVVIEKTSGRKLEVFTNEPGVQFYSGNFMDGSQKGRGTAYQFRTGFCLETQHFPDSPNQPAFPSTVLKPGEKYSSQTIYKFSTVK
ncbi:MAG: aldose epimerase family protein [bacterium]|jgi:aldose 1-epimerase